MFFTKFRLEDITDIKWSDSTKTLLAINNSFVSFVIVYWEKIWPVSTDPSYISLVLCSTAEARSGSVFPSHLMHYIPRRKKTVLNSCAVCQSSVCLAVCFVWFCFDSCFTLLISRQYKINDLSHRADTSQNEAGFLYQHLDYFNFTEYNVSLPGIISINCEVLSCEGCLKKNQSMDGF